jgi:hypothetical protein
VFDTSFVLSKTLRSPETFIASVTKQWSKRYGVLIKGDEKTDNNTANKPVPPPKVIPPSTVSTKNLSTVVTGGSSGMVRFKMLNQTSWF